MARDMNSRDARNTTHQTQTSVRKIKKMPKYNIERNIPNAGKMNAAELRKASARSCEVLRNLGPKIQWVQSHVVDHKLFCTYISPDAELIREHARQGGFPADQVHEVRNVIDPTTAESR
jgi:hypothetical protein